MLVSESHSDGYGSFFDEAKLTTIKVPSANIMLEGLQICSLRLGRSRFRVLGSQKAILDVC
jgi:hypothetical protein